MRAAYFKSHALTQISVRTNGKLIFSGEFPTGATVSIAYEGDAVEKINFQEGDVQPDANASPCSQSIIAIDSICLQSPSHVVHRTSVFIT